MKNMKTFVDNSDLGNCHKITFTNCEKVLNICKCNNVTLNREKCQIATMELTFLGDRLPANGLKSDPAKVKPIVEFTTPKEQADVPRF